VQRALAFLAVIVTGTLAHAGTPSNPAFLGVVMDPTRTVGQGCPIISVMSDGAGAMAGLRSGDSVLALDGTVTLNCNDMHSLIVAHQPGDNVRIDVLRSGGRLVLHALLLTRAEVLDRRFVGHTLDNVELTDAEDHSSLEVSELRGATRIVAWFDADHCLECDSLLRAVQRGIDTRTRGATKLLAVTTDADGHLAKSGLADKLGVPLAFAPPQFAEGASLLEADRAYFMVFDSHGIVRFITPVAPEGDDVEAGVDEVLAAAEQAERARLRR
jgi:hypothetical protein